MNNSTPQGNIYSFWQLLQRQRIEIPIIQRDYAQGRENKKELRNDFLNALYRSLDKEESIRLDFIYGSNQNDVFQPLDGQQRLSTLFLLHWYAAVKDGKLTNEVQDILTKFSYETRASSREFCSGLIKETTNIDFKPENISQFIIDSSWFFLSWKKDPTIDAMLRTIDDIHNLFGNMDRMFERLTSDTALIGFYYVVLENFGLTDDLYIKMNARGKLLTPFENFKAKLQERIESNGWENGIDFSSSYISKIDTQWTELFWDHRKKNQIDSSFMRFISTIAMIQMSIEKTDSRIAKIRGLNNEPDLVRVESFSQSGYKYLADCLDIYCKVYNEKTSLIFDFPFWQHQPEDNLFTALVYEGNSASYSQKALFYAQTEYLLRASEFNQDKFYCWMRVIRNIVSRGDVQKTGKRTTIIRSPESFDGIISLIKELSEGCDDIHKFLSTYLIKSSFSKDQTEEEKRKSILITEDDRYKDIIFSLEDTYFCQGRVGFALYCIDDKKCINDFDFEKLKQLHKVFITYLSGDLTNDFRRGLLTICDQNGRHSYYDYWWSWSYAVNANKRCLIVNDHELEYFIYGSYKTRDRNYKTSMTKDHYKQYLKKLLLQLTEKSLEDIIGGFNPPDNMPNWKVRLIKEPELLDSKCKSKYIAIPEDESCCYLLKGMRPRDIADCEKIE